MKGSEAKMTGFMEGADKRFVIPVYQRKYDWKYDNCRQLYEDLKKIVTDGRESHFFGSIVSAVVPDGSKIEYHIIDGQQRLTTITLLLLAIRNLIAQGKITTNEGRLDEQISQRFLISPWASDDDKIKLRPVKSDREALAKLFSDEEDYDRSSNLTINYRFFYDMILKEEVPVADLYAAVGKLEIISITLDQGDNAQLIFESLNSTGLALTEGDKIRNYVLMGLPAQKQTKYYDTYWAKIEKCTENDVSGFIRDYLSIRQQVTPTIHNVYRSFKTFAESVSLPVDTLLAELLRYARFFEKLLTCKSGLKEQKLDDCLYRLKRLEIVVTRPFLLEVLRLQQDGKLTVDDVLRIFLITENYLFRRNICEVPTNALNKIFLNLNKEILRYDNTAHNYVAKFIYALLSKKESGRFPDDEEFGAALAEKQVYLMRGKYKAYMFERFENYGTIETKDVYTHLDNNVYTIEHIMPQHLTPAWTEALGANAADIHAEWRHRLANLTLTGYNPNLSNNPFAEKRDAKEGGYKASGLKMNQKIAAKQSWGLPELEERNKEMLELAMEIWACPATDFIPAEKEFDSCTLDDENYDLTGRDIAKYSYLNAEQPVTSWTDMFEHVVKFLHQKDKSILTGLAYSPKNNTELAVYVSDDESELRSALKIDDHVFVEKNTSTALKMSILRRIFALYEADPMDLVFYLKNADAKKSSDASRYESRRRYWEYALPIIQKQHIHRGTFSGCNPTTSNTESGSFGISGFSINCVANYDNARIDFYLGNSDTTKNKSTFDMLYQHRNEIEGKLGISLSWDRADHCKASWMSYKLDGVGIANESDWPRMARFHAEWSDKICSAMLEYLLDDKEKRMAVIVGILREWAQSRIIFIRRYQSMSFNRPDIYDLLDTMTLEGKEKLYEDLRVMIAAEKSKPRESFLEEQWHEIIRLINTLKYEPYIDDQWEIEEIWNICEELIKDGRLKDESWEIRRQVLEGIIEGEYYDFYGVYDPMRDLFHALMFTQEEKLECADIIFGTGSDYMKADGAKLYKECGQQEKYIRYIENHLGDKAEPYMEVIKYYRGKDTAKAIVAAEYGLKKCKEDQTDIILFLLEDARDIGDKERYARFMKSAKMRRLVDFEKVQKIFG